MTHNQLHPESGDRPCVLLVAIRGFHLKSNRSLLMQHFLAQGWQVVAAVTPDKSVPELVEAGIEVEPVVFNRGGLSPFGDLKALWSLARLFGKYSPRLILFFQVKPIILGGMAAYLRGGKALVVNSITGLGHAFTVGGFTRWLAGLGYRIVLPRCSATVFENPDDQALFVEEEGWLPPEKARLIVSEGVDTQRFHPSQAPREGAPRVLMVTRLLWQKGVREFVEAADLVRQDLPSIRFQLAGEWDFVHPDAVDEPWVQAAVDRGSIEFLGYLTDMDAQLRDIDLFVLPSYYGEGAPRVLLEAAASGVPVVTTDSIGCRELVIDGQTGRLVPPKDSLALAAAVREILSDPDLKASMGRAGRAWMEKDFDIQVITERYLQIYRDIGIDV